jgi:hypothetical protein
MAEVTIALWPATGLPSQGIIRAGCSGIWARSAGTIGSFGIASVRTRVPNETSEAASSSIRSEPGASWATAGERGSGTGTPSAA